MHPRWLRCSSLKHSRYSRSSRLAIVPLARLGATPDFHHGLLTIRNQQDSLTSFLASRWDPVYKPRFKAANVQLSRWLRSAGSKSASCKSVGITGLSEPRVDPTALFRAIVESADDAITSTDLQETITSWNRAAERLYGYSAAETIGKSNRMIIPPDRYAEEDAVVRRLRSGEAVGQSIRLIIPDSHLDEEDTILNSIKRGESVQHFETIRCRKDGSCLPISVTVSPIRNKAGVIIGASKIARDISDRKRAEAETRRAKRQAEFVARMAEVLSGSLDYVARLKDLTKLVVPSIADWAAVDVLEGDGHIRRVAVAHADPTKTQLDTEIRSHHQDPTGPCNARQVIRTGKSVLVAEITDDMIVAAAKGDEERARLMRALGLVSCMCVPLKNHGSIAALTLATAESARQYGTDDLRFAEDMASRAALMDDNARAYADVRRANRLKDEFLATLSHELRTPLNAILGYARMLRAGMLTPDKFQRTFETIERNTSALTQMVEDIIDVSRVVSGKMRLNMQPVELPIVLNEAVATVMPAA